jgi:hypothetical protein
MAARRPPSTDLGGDARHYVGLRPLLFSYHDCELEIPLYHPDRFLNPDYNSFDCGGMAFTEAYLKLLLPKTRESQVGRSFYLRQPAASFPPFRSAAMVKQVRGEPGKSVNKKFT